MSQLNLKILTPEKEAYAAIVDKIVAPTNDGEIGILPQHIDLIAQLVPGELIITKNDHQDSFAIGEGLIKVSQNQVTILADLAEHAKDIDEKAVEEARQRAQKALEEDLSDEEYAYTIAVLDKSLAQLKVKRRHRL